MSTQEGRDGPLGRPKHAAAGPAVPPYRMNGFARGLCVGFLMVGSLLHAASTMAAAPEDPWQTRLPAFSVDAPPRGEQPILLYFSASWCGFCKQMERTTLAEPEVRAEVARLRAHKIDFDAQGGLVERFGIRGIPAFVLTNDRGEVIDRLTGASPKEAFLKWLAAGESAAARAAQGARERAAVLASMVAALKSPDEEVRTWALTACWRLAGRGDDFERKEASGTLAALFGDSGVSQAIKASWWRMGLAHADLAVRVAAANLLRSAMPDAAKLYDPWTEEAARAEAITRLGF